MKKLVRRPTSLRREIARLEGEVAELTAARNRLRSEIDLQAVRGASHPAARPPRLTEPLIRSTEMSVSDDCVYVLDDDTDEARAFDDFYRAYDEVHVKTRKFLLG